MKLEVCIDNIESAIIAENAGADRLEICSSLALGGLTSSYSLIKNVINIVNIPCYIMIRPRAGDFLFSTQEVNMMLDDIRLAKQLGAQGIVIGALTKHADIDLSVCETLIQAAEGLGVTFHRAFDLCRDPVTSLEQLIQLGCERVLTSGQKASAVEGQPLIKQLVSQASNRIRIMAGAGINAQNAALLVKNTGITELHLSGKGYRLSEMPYHANAVMGENGENDQKIWRTDFDKIRAVKASIEKY
ncbi:copper homeostasis protein CutC [Pasteurella multocida]|uniref:copper homeostasis protein CutC n=1 Tax=Pasteurella multocida TaxID=747 RepID=UPI0024478D1E|nr:copper homeostasis protein CutC [Pasteurella multocida]MDH3003637.1 copper homeostasis protein CutC [Pasteurella multocida]